MNHLKHKIKDLSLQELIGYMRTEEANRLKDKSVQLSLTTIKANLVETGGSSNGEKFKGKGRAKASHGQAKGRNAKKSGQGNFTKPASKIHKPNQNLVCYVCGKPGHKAYQCPQKKVAEANLAEKDDIIDAVVVEANLVANASDWILDTGASRLLCANKELFAEFEDVADGECVYMGNSSSAVITGKGKIFLKLTSGKTLALNNVLYVPTLRRNLVSGALLNKAGVKLKFLKNVPVVPRYTKVYLLKNKSEAEDMFLKFKAEVQNQLDRKIKRVRFMSLSDRSISEARDAEVFEHVFPLKKDVSLPVVPVLPINPVDSSMHASSNTSVDHAFEPRRSKRPRIKKNFDCVIICLYVDDMLILGSNLFVVNKTKQFLSSRFEMKDLGEADVILGVRVVKNSNGISLSQSHYVEKVLKKFKSFDVIPARTPYDASVSLCKNLGDSVSQEEYAKIIGSVMFLMNCTRPDIAYAVSRLSRKFPAVLEGYCDAKWVSGNDEICSSSGYVFTLGKGAISWKSVKQTCIAHSTMESEFIALELAGQEADWLRNLLADVPMWGRQVAIGVAKNHVYNGKRRHIRIRHGVVKQLQKNGVIALDYVKSEPLLRSATEKHLSYLWGCDGLATIYLKMPPKRSAAYIQATEMSLGEVTRMIKQQDALMEALKNVGKGRDKPREMESLLEVLMKCQEDMMVDQAVFYLRDEAGVWWQNGLAPKNMDRLLAGELTELKEVYARVGQPERLVDLAKEA
ncbi:uncharacterized protein LOC141590312 [Silene latifolia]|uniref:uncharacterized protein LOC141590312 n=1 Tax=Silene latifolia TaxID=37657 RepID=UPI003D77436F